MISVKNVKKYFQNTNIFNDFNLELPSKGLVAIFGRSGCGKTTLLNMLSGLLKPDKGDIYIDETRINKLPDNRLSYYRLNNFGFIFQDFKLFETETVLNNITLPLETLTIVSNKYKRRKAKDLLDLVDLSSKANSNVNLLSGGEKQRVAIARSLINNPKVVFADEPTGALDEASACLVLKILKKISLSALVVVVSHDIQLISNYADRIIHLNDGVIEKDELLENKVDDGCLFVSKERKRLKKPRLPFEFLFHHSFKKMKEKRWRTLFCEMVMSTSLIGIGISISLTSSISANIKKAYGDIIGDSRICVDKKKETISKYGTYSVSQEDAYRIAYLMSDYVYDIGVCYHNNFDSLFFDANEFYFTFENREIYVDGLSSDNINEYEWIEDLKTSEVLPKETKSIELDEVVLGLPINMIRDICYGLRIERTVNSLSSFLTDHKLKATLCIENKEWQLLKTIDFKIAGFILQKQPAIYHSSHLWNEYVFEQLLKMPTTSYISGFSKYPWDLKKIYFLKMMYDSEAFLTKAFDEVDLAEYVFEIADKTYYPILYKNKEFRDYNRLLVFKNYLLGINPKISPFIESACKGLSNPIFASGGGYSIYPSAFMSGFSNPTYFSSSFDKLEEAIDILSSFSSKLSDVDELPPGIIDGYYAKSLQKSVSFSPTSNISWDDYKLNQVVISKGLSKELFENDNNIKNKKLYLSFNSNEIELDNGRIKRDFINAELEIIGISDENKLVIHQSPKWAILFFQCYLGVSIFNLDVYSLSYMVDSKSSMSSLIDKGNLNFRNLEFYDPMSDFNLGVDEVCNFIQIALLIFSVISTLVSVLLLSTCTYLHVIENKKDIGLARCLGIKKMESVKFVFSYSLLNSFICFIIASIELLVFTIFSMSAISKALSSTAVLTLNPLAFLFMFGTSFGVALISSALFSRKIVKLNPLESLKG